MMILCIKNFEYLQTIRIYQRSKRHLFYSVPNNFRQSINDDYEFIQKSKTPTMHFQKSLPRLPIPKLEDSCKRYLKSQQPILSQVEWKQTSKYVDEFLLKDGPMLQKLLLDEDTRNKHTSYISEPWFDMYLRDRKPLPINYNPILVFVQENNKNYNKPLVKGTNLLISSARFMKSLKNGILDPEVFHLDPKKSNTGFFKNFTRILPSSIATYGAYLFKAFPLDMSQFSNLFGTSRIPEIGKDILYHNDSPKHVIIMRRGHFYSMDLLTNNGNIKSPVEIATCLNSILKDQRSPNQYPLGVLTTLERDQWAKIRKYLLNLGNDNVIKKIDSAAFVFIIDDDENNIETDYHKLLRLFLHGDGTNRWFDKSFSIIMTGDGIAGINFEHSWGDGVAVLRYFKDLKHDIEDKPRFHPENESEIPNHTNLVERLDFVIDDMIKDTINRAFSEYKSWTLGRLTVDYLIYEGFGKEKCKGFGVSPDAIMQLAFQLALYKREAQAVATYESCSTSAFKHGRTETLRSCTNETKALCSVITQQKNNSTIYDHQLKKMIIECSKVHNNLTKEAAMGQGFDRHLFALKKQCEKHGQDLPEFFKDPAYAKINHNILSTSTLSSPEVLAGGFGPAVENGYGIGYMIQDHKLGSVVTSYRQHRDASDYINYLKSAFEDIHRILQSK